MTNAGSDKTVGERTLVSFDYAVKYMLRGKAPEDFIILGGFLSELLGRNVIITGPLESESNKIDPDDKTNRVDLKAQIDGGEYVVFEFQFYQEYDFFGRVLFGVSKTITEQVSSGGFYNIKKVLSINIVWSDRLNAKREYLFHGKFDEFHGVHFKEESIPFAQTVDTNSKAVAELHPEYYLLLPNMFDETMRNLFDEWVYTLKTSKVRDDFTAAGIKEAKVKLDLLNMSKEERQNYEKYLDNRRSANSVVIAAKMEGMAEGIAQIVRNMHKKGRSITEIAEITMLPESDVRKILETETKT